MHEVNTPHVVQQHHTSIAHIHFLPLYWLVVWLLTNECILAGG